MAELELTIAHAEGAFRGGLATVTTDANGQAKVVFPEPFPVVPAAIVTTPKNVIVNTGTLELTERHVIIWVWETVGGRWYANNQLDLYWLGIF